MDRIFSHNTVKAMLRTQNVIGNFRELVEFFVIVVIPCEIVLGLFLLSDWFERADYRPLRNLSWALCFLLACATVVWVIWFSVVWIRKRQVRKSRLGLWFGILSPFWIFFILGSSLLAEFLLRGTTAGPDGTHAIDYVFSGLFLYGLWGVALFLAISGLGSGFIGGKIGGLATILEFLAFVMMILNGGI